MEKYLHVSFMVRQQNLYDLLHALEEHKVGNVEVRAVSRMLNGAAEEPAAPIRPQKHIRRRPDVRKEIAAAMKLNEPFSYWALATKMGLNPKSVATSMTHFQKAGIVRKVKKGIYMRIKEGV